MNPSPSQLLDQEQYKLINTVHYSEIKPFIKSLFALQSPLLKGFGIFQIISLIIPLGLLGYELIQVFFHQSSLNEVYCIFGGTLFSFSFLIIIHELIHLLGFKLLGKKQLSIGGNIKTFLFYVEAHEQVINKRQYTMIAILPFVFVLTFTLIGANIFWTAPCSLFFITVGAIHSLFCAGDIAMIVYMHHFKSETYTYDNVKEKVTYFYQKV